jgi:hypothetical protein
LMLLWPYWTIRWVFRRLSLWTSLLLFPLHWDPEFSIYNDVKVTIKVILQQNKHHLIKQPSQLHPLPSIDTTHYNNTQQKHPFC